MNLTKLARSWDRLGRDDAMWAVLYDPAKRGNQWDPEEFFATGQVEIDSTMAYLEGLGVTIAYERALDFGCGVGRLTQPLAARFAVVDGVDIAASMVALAREHNSWPNCTFHVNEADDLSLFADGTFDLVHSRLVLQHIPPSLSKRYLREFVRVLKPGGVAVFDMPSASARSLKARIATRLPTPVLNSLRRLRYRSGVMELHWVDPGEVASVIDDAGGRVVDAGPIAAAPGSLITKHRYCVVRAASSS
jgi:SAM-dependent methyltransferase